MRAYFIISVFALCLSFVHGSQKSGITRDEVSATLGRPQGRMGLGDEEIWLYPHQQFVFVGETLDDESLKRFNLIQESPAALLGARESHQPSASQSPVASPASQVSPQSNPQVITGKIQRAENATVRITHKNGSGSGFFISPEGWLVTNCHVLETSGPVYVEARNGEKWRVDQVVTFDRSKDLAIIKLDGGPFPYLSPVLTVPKRGDTMFVFGHGHDTPWGFTRGYVVSLPDREERQEVQFSADISPGNSGGPVISDISGRYMAVSTYIKYHSINFNNAGVYVIDPSRAFKFGVAHKEVSQLMDARHRSTTPSELLHLSTAVKTAGLLVDIIIHADDLARNTFQRFSQDVHSIPIKDGTSSPQSKPEEYIIIVSSRFVERSRQIQSLRAVLELTQKDIVSYPARYDAVGQAIHATRKLVADLDAACRHVVSQNGRRSESPISLGVTNDAVGLSALEAVRDLVGFYKSNSVHMSADEKEKLDVAVSLFRKYRRHVDYFYD